ncbi:DUF6814 family protein [Robiginitalea sp. IMCC43444]|uniref:DUF6814 family protein n=1 Tax=Robiginitalea sp. IMCC43444 TaxID=3459121 RepID=UPI0040438E0A
MQLYSDMSIHKRVLFWMGRGVIKPLFGLIGIFMGLFLIYMMFFNVDEATRIAREENMKDITNWILGIIIVPIITIGPIWFGVSSIRDSFNTYKDVKLMEKIFLEQGGFFWSNQQYGG